MQARLRSREGRLANGVGGGGGGDSMAVSRIGGHVRRVVNWPAQVQHVLIYFWCCYVTAQGGAWGALDRTPSSCIVKVWSGDKRAVLWLC